MNKQAEKLNQELADKAPGIASLLSESGKAAFFPKGGILAQTAEAKGTNFNATIGEAYEDDDSPMVMDVLAETTSMPKDAFMYAGSFGQKKLRELWQQEIKRKSPSLTGAISMPIVAAGLTHGLTLAYKLLVDKDDKIILPDLFWGNYNLTFEGTAYEKFTLFTESGFNVAGLKEKLLGNGEKKILLLNFPNNPAGYTPTNEEVAEIVAAIKEAAEAGKKIAVIIDDAYFGLVFAEGVYKESIFAPLADLHENVLAVKVDGTTKEMFAWGLRVAFVTVAFKGMQSEATIFEDKLAGLVRGTISNAPNISEYIAMHALESDKFAQQQAEKAAVLQERFSTVKEVLGKNEQFKEAFEVLPYNSGYFMCIRLKNKDAEEIRKRLIVTYNTGLISIGNDILRIAYSSVGKEKLPKIFENIYEACTT